VKSENIVLLKNIHFGGLPRDDAHVIIFQNYIILKFQNCNRFIIAKVDRVRLILRKSA